MTEFSALLEHGNAWFFIPSAIMLGALHGLEPGHSKTMMAAFIVAVRGTVGQAILLGLAATLSHTSVVWLVALSGMYFGQSLNAEDSEPYFQIASALLIVGIALWMLWQITRSQNLPHGHSHGATVGHRHIHQDSHELAHAHDIETRFANRRVTTGQIIMFGLTGGLIPCPASITVLLLCLQLKKITLGAALVLCFSVGLALTLVASGVIAAMGVSHISKRWSGFAEFSRKAPYFSGAIILLVGLYVGYQGLHGAGYI
jgi:nickel/cobalt transporter (NicO) family protein